MPLKKRHLVMKNSEFHKVLAEMAALHDSKNADYANDEDPFYNFRRSEALGVPAWLGAIVRAGDKMARIESFVQKGKLNHEGIEDSLIDAANYFVLALVLYREIEKGKSDISDSTIDAQVDSVLKRRMA